MADQREETENGSAFVRRHRFSTRVWHWVNAATFIVMLMSGLMIFNAHPRLYWGEYGANHDAAWLEIAVTPRGEGVLNVADFTIRTTGVLGVSTDAEGTQQELAFPGWATIPSRYSLADARLWHLAFAWVLAVGLLVFLLWSLVSGHLQRDIHITRREWRVTNIWHDIKEHARLRFPRGEAALRYSTLQKLAYAGVLFLMLPLVIATGLAMSPGMDAAWPWLTQVLGGRQSARSIHFVVAFALLAFLIVHLAMVMLSGPLNGIRAMITGWYRLPPERENGT